MTSEERATQAHALHQRLQAIGKKLHEAGGGASVYAAGSA